MTHNCMYLIRPRIITNTSGCLGDVEADSELQMKLLDQARLVAQAVGKLVGDCKEVARSCTDPEMQQQVRCDCFLL